MLVDWRYSGPPSGVGSKARVTTKLGGMTDEAEIEVVAVEPGRMIRERNIGAKGKRVAHGTYELSDLPDGGTRIEFTWALEQAPLADRALAPVLRGMLSRGNARAMQRLAEQLR
jgi:polyketide cyclase/dehydrase/lipid transport protein